MAHFSKRNRRREREVQQALNNRLELVKEGFTRRDLMKMGVMTGAGVLIPKLGLTHAYGQDLTAASSFSKGLLPQAPTAPMMLDLVEHRPERVSTTRIMLPTSRRVPAPSSSVDRLGITPEARVSEPGLWGRNVVGVNATARTRHVCAEHKPEHRSLYSHGSALPFSSKPATVATADDAVFRSSIPAATAVR